MTNNISNNNLLTGVVRTVSSFLSSLFVSSSTKEFNRLKNFIAS